jgi:hypothetical protein
MNDRELQACKTARTLSSMAALTAVIVTLILSRVLDVQSMQWQVVIATVALAAGIPHGALDHLVARPVGNGSTMSGFVVRYVLTAIVALVAILLFNVIGFVFVLVMSAVHFGTGDAAFVAEINKRIAATTKHRTLLYAVPAGLLPIVVPLTKSTSENALNEINTNVVRWHAGFDSALLIATALISLAAFIALLATKRYRDAIDIVLLALLGVVCGVFRLLARSSPHCATNAGAAFKPTSFLARIDQECILVGGSTGASSACWRPCCCSCNRCIYGLRR